jgi:hypothetical protein
MLVAGNHDMLVARARDDVMLVAGDDDTLVAGDDDILVAEDDGVLVAGGAGDLTSAQPAFYVPTIWNSWGKCKAVRPGPPARSKMRFQVFPFVCSSRLARKSNGFLDTKFPA